MKVREVITLIERDGWYLVQIRGTIGSISTRRSRDG
jgi:predicted RNA binding protein YcfA (HicA-like mRNA interferase family)